MLNMGKCAQLFILICVLLYVSVGAKQYTDDYCWRDYDGVIPLDAFEAGSDKNGRTLYIGQVLHESKIVPGKIYSGDKKVYFEFYDVEYTSSQNIKILCSRSRNTFQWIPTQHNQAHTLVPHNTLIKGGFEAKCSTYLGRSKRRPGAEIGKVMCCEAATHCYGLYTTTNGKGDLEVEFDILAYNGSNNDNNNISNTNYGIETSTTERINVATPDRTKDQCKEITINMFY